MGKKTRVLTKPPAPIDCVHWGGENQKKNGTTYKKRIKQGFGSDTTKEGEWGETLPDRGAEGR